MEGWVSELTENQTNRNKDDITVVLYGIISQKSKLTRHKIHYLYVTEERGIIIVEKNFQIPQEFLGYLAFRSSTYSSS